MSRRLLWMCCLAALARAQQPPEDILLQSVRRKVTQAVERMPRYTCTQTIDRFQYLPEPKHDPPACDHLIAETADGKWKPRLTTSDRLRLDVAIAENREMYSWVGENRFEDRSLTELVREGAISTGSFSAFLMAIFAGTSATFSYRGEKIADGRRLAEFGFEVPLRLSHYSFNGRQGTPTITAYGGTFLADPNTADLVRLAIHTTGLLPDSGSCQATTTMDYSRVQLNAGDFLLPKEVLLRIVDTSGAENVNRTAFSECHEFVGESTVRFDPSDDTGPGAAHTSAAAQPFVISPGIRFTVALAQNIDAATAAAGDPLKARLAGPIRDHKKVIVPGNATVSGRIVEVRRYYAAPPSLLVRFKLETVTVAGQAHPLAAKVVPMDFSLPALRAIRNNSLPREFAGTLGGEKPGTAAVAFRGVDGHYVIRRGFALDWVTTEAAGN